MNILDAIFHKRLDRIREELNEYITANLRKRMFTPPVMDKFLNIMKLNDGEDSDYFNEELENYEDEEQSSKNIVPARVKDEKYLALDKALENKQESFSKLLLRIIDKKGFRDTDVYENIRLPYKKKNLPEKNNRVFYKRIASYEDCKLIIDSYKQGVICICSILLNDGYDAQGMMNYLCGAIYALEGEIISAGGNVYCLC